MTQNSKVMVGLTISMHFQQFEDLTFQRFFPGEYGKNLHKRTHLISVQADFVLIHRELSAK